MSKSDTGCRIPCFDCGTTFSSKGLRCCSPGCEREFSRDFPNATAFTAGPRPTNSETAICARPSCRKPFPRSGRRRYCSDACRQRDHHEKRSAAP
jgi:hypothetical protein